MRRCTKCLRELPESAFAWKNQARGVKVSWCRDCQAVAHRDHYLKNKKRYLQQAKDSCELTKQYVISKKNAPCMDCGGSFHHSVMDFDHVRGDKVMAIAQLLRLNSRSRIDAEIAKCELVCANCHRVRTWNRSHPTRMVGS